MYEPPKLAYHIRRGYSWFTYAACSSDHRCKDNCAIKDILRYRDVTDTVSIDMWVFKQASIYKEIKEMLRNPLLPH